MKTKINTSRILIAALTFGIGAFMSSCDSEVSSKGTASVGVTDAAVDAENITGVYLKVNQIEAKGSEASQTIAQFDEPKTFNVMDFQNGAKYDLGEGEIESGVYTELRLILAEGSYVKFKDGTTEPLEVPSGTASGYKIKGDYQISANNETKLVIDIDLRKAFVLTGNGQYKLRPTARLSNDDNTATINGTMTGNTDDRVVVYAYANGTYSESEANEPADGSSRFENSINSAVVADGKFTLAFMEPGEYEFIVAKYTREEVTESYTFMSSSKVEATVAGSILDTLEIESNTDVNVLIIL
ncbi:MAG: hypothetical protein ACI8WP_000859 [Flavobacteriaceae bacterium]|jgi:hypothetical protein